MLTTSPNTSGTPRIGGDAAQGIQRLAELGAQIARPPHGNVRLAGGLGDPEIAQIEASRPGNAAQSGRIPQGEPSCSPA